MFRPEKQVPIGFIVGLGAAASAALAACYVLYKKDDESFTFDSRDQETAGTSSESMENPLASTPSFQAIKPAALHKQIPKEAIGSIIGRHGENIKLIQRKTNTKITCANGITNGSGAEEIERTLVIKGSPAGILAADEEIDSIIEQAMSLIVHRIFISPSEVGLIIGKYGASIKTMAEQSGAKIKIPNKDNRNHGKSVAIEIKGEPASVDAAIKMINDRLKITRANRSRFYSNSPVSNQRNGNGVSSSYINFIPTYANISQIDQDKFEQLESTAVSGCRDVYVSHVFSPSKFYVQPCGAISQELDRLMMNMTEYYEKEENQANCRLKKFAIGDIVAAPLKGDEHWYRVEITSDVNMIYSLQGEGEIKVRYLDFGDESIVSTEKICSLHEEFLIRIPFQAVECSLFGVEPISGDWSSDAIDYFKKAAKTTLWEKMLASTHKVIHKENENRDRFIIELLSLQNDKDVSLSDLLVEQGFAIATADS